MLKSLFIQNYAIIDELTMLFGNKLNIITGETGAGKSILTGALGLIQGNRADTKVLYDDSKKCIVEAEFSNNQSEIKTLFQQHDLDYENPIVIRRVISTSGKSRAFVNDEPVKLNFLKELSSLLVDMHRQFDTLGINQEATQISMLDSLADNQKNLDAYQETFKSYRKHNNQLKQLIDEEAKVNQELDFFNFQLTELDEAGFEKGEQEGLENEVNLMENADGVITNMQKINFVLEDSENSISSQIAELRNELERLGDVGEDAQGVLERLNSAEEELRDIAYQASSVSDKVDVDPKRLEEKKERLDLLYRLLQKHHKETLDELVEYHEEIADKVMKLSAYGKDRTELESTIAKEQKELENIAGKITEKRKKTIPSFESKILGLLQNLGMEHAIFKIDINQASELRPTGRDEIQFLFSANPGKAPQSIHEVASGGELSRLALSLKSTVAGKIDLGTLIFDEIDTGISGEVSGKMGTILKKLADQHQIISITHSPQIASKADTHFFIYKVVEQNRTFTKVQKLDNNERVIEIAKMLSGDPPSDGAMKNARELMGA